jgi:hypothetical protein
MPTRLVPITVRLEEEFYDEIVDLAKSEGRSINKQMVLLMRLGHEYFKPTMPAKRGRPKKIHNK